MPGSGLRVLILQRLFYFFLCKGFRWFPAVSFPWNFLLNFCSKVLDSKFPWNLWSKNFFSFLHETFFLQNRNWVCSDFFRVLSGTFENFFWLRLCIYTRDRGGESMKFCNFGTRFFLLGTWWTQWNEPNRIEHTHKSVGKARAKRIFLY